MKGKIVNLQGSGCKGSLILDVEEKKGLPGGGENSLRFHRNRENENALNVFGINWGRNNHEKRAIRLNCGRTLPRDDVTSSRDHKLPESAPQLGFIFNTTPMESR